MAAFSGICLNDHELPARAGSFRYPTGMLGKCGKIIVGDTRQHYATKQTIVT